MPHTTTSFGRNAIRDPEKSDLSLQPALSSGVGKFELNAKAIRTQNSGHLPTASSGLGEQDWEAVSARTEAGSLSFDRTAFEIKIGSGLVAREWIPRRK